MKKSILTIIVASTLIFSSCANVVRTIPSGYVGKELTPTGFSEDILESGQVDLGAKNSNGTSTSLVLLEVTTTTIKESFDAEGLDKNEAGDHRVRTKDGAPVAVDIYVQVAVPQDKKLRDGLYAMISPEQTKGDERVSVITIDAIYSQFAKMTIRGNVRPGNINGHGNTSALAASSPATMWDGAIPRPTSRTTPGISSWRGAD